MSLKSILKRVVKAAPVIIANAPAVIAAAKQVKKALKKPSPKA
jgi:hypothetical protein